MVDAHELKQAATIQEVAAKRHEWVALSREEYHMYKFAGLWNLSEDAVSEYVLYSAERAEYAHAAMKLMGITEDDQIN